MRVDCTHITDFTRPHETFLGFGDFLLVDYGIKLKGCSIFNNPEGVKVAMPAVKLKGQYCPQVELEKSLDEKFQKAAVVAYMAAVGMLSPEDAVEAQLIDT